MQPENSGSSPRKKQEEKISEHENSIVPDTGGNEYTAAFMLYCQKTLDNFRRMYASDTMPEFESRIPFSSSLRSGVEENEFELDEDEEIEFDDEEREALKELSEQFERMFKQRTETEENEFELDEDEETELDDEERETLRELSEQFEQLLKARTEFEDDEAEANNHKEKGALGEAFSHFEQILKDREKSGLQSEGGKEKDFLEFLNQIDQLLNIDSKAGDDSFPLEEYDLSQSNGHTGKKESKELLEQPGQAQRKAREGAALDHASPNFHGSDATESSIASGNNGLSSAEIDEALSGVGEAVKSAKKNLGIVEIFWEESEAQRADRLAIAGITQEDFEQTVARTGTYLYDVRDYLEGWADLSMLPEIYEQLLLANNELSELLKKMYGERIVELLGKRKEDAYEEEDDLDFDDDDDDDDDWELDDDDWDSDDEEEDSDV